MIQIAILNNSTVVDDAMAATATAALQRQVSEHFAPLWGVDARLTYMGKGVLPPTGSWWLQIVDDAAQAVYLGYHDLTTDGLPLGFVFAATDIRLGYSWTVTASHELLEMLGDPDINLMANQAS